MRLGEKRGTYAIIMTEAKKLANEELTACSELARDESIVSISFPNRFNMRP